MSKFATRGGTAATTYEGGPGYTRTPFHDLVIAAATNMVGEDTFYETARDRDARFRDVVARATASAPAAVAAFVPFLRDRLNMRSASVVVAAEYALTVRRRAECGERGGCTAPALWEDADNAQWCEAHRHSLVVRIPTGPPPRRVVSAALQRADEPAEFLAYWKTRTGRLPTGGVQRGVADAVVRLYDERSALRYDGKDRPWRFGSVIEVTHPRPRDENQAALFAWLIGEAQNGSDNHVPVDALPVITQRRKWDAIPVEDRADEFRNLGTLAPAALRRAGMSWESLAGWLQGPLTARVWESVIPTMGYMALLRNLRNFDAAGVSDEAKAAVAARLADPEQVARSRQFPYRFLSAYRAVSPAGRDDLSGLHVTPHGVSRRRVPTVWDEALEAALNHATSNVPALPGRWLVLVDTSASMRDTVSAKSQVRHVDIAGLFGSVLAARATGGADLVGFATGAFTHRVDPASILGTVASLDARIGEVGHGTDAIGAFAATYGRQHRGVVIVSDMQIARGYFPGHDIGAYIPPQVPLFTVNTSGYATAAVNAATPNRYEIGGFSDALFTLVGMLAQSPGEVERTIRDAVGA